MCNTYLHYTQKPLTRAQEDDFAACTTVTAPYKLSNMKSSLQGAIKGTAVAAGLGVQVQPDTFSSVATTAASGRDNRW